MRLLTFDELRDSYRRAVIAGTGMCMEPDRCPALTHMRGMFVAYLDELERNYSRVVIGDSDSATLKDQANTKLSLFTPAPTRFVTLEEFDSKLENIESSGSRRCTLPNDCRARFETRDRFNRFFADLQAGNGLVLVMTAPRYRRIARRVSALEHSPGRLKRSATDLIRQGARSRIP